MPPAQNMIVIVSPHTGFLDQALPFAHYLKQNKSESRISFFFPKPGTALLLSTGGKPVVLANSIGDSFNFPISRKVWLNFSSATKAGEVSKSLRYLVSGSLRLQNRLPLRLSNFVDYLVYEILRLLGFAPTRGIGETQPGKSLVIFDILEVHEPYFEPFLSVTSNCDAIAIVHGFVIFEGHGVWTKALYSSWLSSRKSSKLLVCAQSEREADHYVRSFGLGERDIIVTGIPRHHPDWVSFMGTKPLGQSSAKRNGNILLISRPGGSLYLPHAKKEKYIAEVGDLASSVGLRILVKLHPREIYGEVYDRILGPSNKGRTWDFTDSHVFELHDQVIFAVSFLSGVPLDLIQLGIPTIERLDLRGVSEWGINGSDRDALHHMATMYRKYGLVRGATTEAEFFSIATEILTDRNHVVAELKSNYQNCFFTPPLSASFILGRLNE